jgi:hypothetical protein
MQLTDFRLLHNAYRGPLLVVSTTGGINTIPSDSYVFGVTISYPLCMHEDSLCYPTKMFSVFFFGTLQYPDAKDDINEFLRPSRVFDGMTDIEEEDFRWPTILEVA